MLVEIIPYGACMNDDTFPDTLPSILSFIFPDTLAETLSETCPDTLPNNISDTFPDTLPDTLADTISQNGNLGRVLGRGYYIIRSHTRKSNA